MGLSYYIYTGILSCKAEYCQVLRLLRFYITSLVRRFTVYVKKIPGGHFPRRGLIQVEDHARVRIVWTCEVYVGLPICKGTSLITINRELSLRRISGLGLRACGVEARKLHPQAK